MANGLHCQYIAQNGINKVCCVSFPVCFQDTTLAMCTQLGIASGRLTTIRWWPTLVRKMSDSGGSVLAISSSTCIGKLIIITVESNCRGLCAWVLGTLHYITQTHDIILSATVKLRFVDSL